MKREIKEKIFGLIFSFLMIFYTIAFMFPNGVFSKLSLYIITQFFMTLM